MAAEGEVVTNIGHGSIVIGLIHSLVRAFPKARPVVLTHILRDDEGELYGWQVVPITTKPVARYVGEDRLPMLYWQEAGLSLPSYFMKMPRDLPFELLTGNYVGELHIEDARVLASATKDDLFLSCLLERQAFDLT